MDRSLSAHRSSTLVADVAVVTAFVAICAIFPLNCTAATGEKPLKQHFGSAGRSPAAAEMTQMRREARLMPPPRKGTIAVLFVHVIAIVAVILEQKFSIRQADLVRVFTPKQLGIYESIHKSGQ